MPSAEEQLYALLDGSSALAALVDESIYPDVIPPDVALPAVVYARSGTEPVNTIHAPAVAAFVLMQIQCWDATRSGAEAVGDAVVAALAAGGEVYTARSVVFDEESGNAGCLIDVRMFVQ